MKVNNITRMVVLCLMSCFTFVIAAETNSPELERLQKVQQEEAELLRNGPASHQLYHRYQCHQGRGEQSR